MVGFLCALERLEGMLFLTTNRVGTFKDALVSRIHVNLFYPDLSESDRTKIWKSLNGKLSDEREDTMRVTIDAKDYIASKALHKLGLRLNGREITNAFQTTVALAEFEGTQDEEGRVLVLDHHLRQVMEMSREFKQYLEKLHIGDESKRAEREGERLDALAGAETDEDE